VNAQETADILGIHHRRRHNDLREMALTLFPWFSSAGDEKRREAERWGTDALYRVSSGVLEASGASAGMWRKSISRTLAGVMIIGSAGLVVLGLKGYWEPGVPFALALIFGFGAAIAWLWDELR